MIGEAMRCPCCRAPEADGLRFCASCGAALREVGCGRCATNNELSVARCIGCGAWLPVWRWLGEIEPLQGGEGRFVLVELLGPGEALVRDRQAAEPNLAPPAGAYADLAATRGMPVVRWWGPEAIVLEVPTEPDGSPLAPLVAAWADATDRTRATYLLAWLRLFASAPALARAPITRPSQMAAGANGELRLRDLEGAGEASLADLGRAWRSLFGLGPSTHLTDLADLMARGGLTDPAGVAERLSTFLARPPVHLICALATDVGRVRAHNEDNVLAVTLRSSVSWSDCLEHQMGGLYAVCDGMGGHQHGEVASRLAIDALRREVLPLIVDEHAEETSFRSAVASCLSGPVNDAVWSLNAARGAHDLGRMGTTLVMLAIRGRQALCAHVGDSRLYALTAQGLTRLTEDHNVANQRWRTGELATAQEAADAARSGGGKALTQAIGARPGMHVVPELTAYDLREPTVFLLCSDGLTDHLEDEALSALLAPVLEEPSTAMRTCQRLVRAANEAGGRDNISVVIVCASPASPWFPSTSITIRQEGMQ